MILLVAWSRNQEKLTIKAEAKFAEDFALVQLEGAALCISPAALKQAGLISYAGGRITLLDRPALETVSCVCYGIVQRHFD